MLDKLDSSLFTWSRWRAGSPMDFMISCRSVSLIATKDILQKHTIGYCNAENLLCRPKRDHKAIMFYKDGRHFWFHVSNKEYRKIYKGEDNEVR